MRALHLERDHVLAQRPGRVLVLADALQYATPRAAHQRPDQHADHRDHRPAEHHHEQSVAVEHLLADVEAIVVDPRVEVLEEPGPALLAIAATREPREPRRVDEVTDDLGRGDRDDRQVVGPQPQCWKTEEQGEGDRGDEDDRQGGVPRPVVLGDRDGEGVGPHGGESGLAEVEQAGVSDVDVEAHGDQAVRRSGSVDRRVQRVPEDQFPIHGFTSLIRCAPCCRESPADG